MCTIRAEQFVQFTGPTLDWPDFSGLVSSRVEIMVEVCPQNFLTFISRDVKMAKNRKNRIKLNHWLSIIDLQVAETREKSKLVKTKPKIQNFTAYFYKNHRNISQNGMNSNMDTIFRSMKITNERLDENGRIFIDQSELRIFYSYLEILSHFR